MKGDILGCVGVGAGLGCNQKGVKFVTNSTSGNHGDMASYSLFGFLIVLYIYSGKMGIFIQDGFVLCTTK